MLDASVTLAWLFADEATPVTDAVFALADEATIHVPVHWFVEVTSGAVKGEWRRRVRPAETDQFLQRLAGLDLVVDSDGVEAAFDRLLPLARDYRLSVYDAGYLELAMRLGLPLACKDGSPVKAARAAGVTVIGR